MAEAGANTPKKGPSPLVEMAMGFFRSRALCAAARLAIADAIGAGEKFVDQLARECGADPSALYRLLRALASFGIVRETEHRHFAMTPLGATLRKDAPDSDWPAVVFWGDLLADCWSQLTDCVRSGQSAWAIAGREGITLKLAKDPETADIFQAVMGTAPAEDYMPLARAWDFSRCRVVSDLGGGGGALIRAVLKGNPNVRGILVDRQGVEAAAARFVSEGLESRCVMIAADLKKTVPTGADVHLLKNVLHAYGDDDAITILKNCRSSLPPDGRLLIIEFVMPDVCLAPDRDLEFRAMSDLNMLAVTGGKERSALEFQELLDRAGFQVNTIIDVSGDPASIIDASPNQ
jgi:hypothetical protein